jgi:hypothetical protein
LAQGCQQTEQSLVQVGIRPTLSKVAKRLPKIVLLASLFGVSVHLIARSKTLTIN